MTPDKQLQINLFLAKWMGLHNAIISREKTADGYVDRVVYRETPDAVFGTTFAPDTDRKQWAGVVLFASERLKITISPTEVTVSGFDNSGAPVTACTMFSSKEAREAEVLNTICMARGIWRGE